MLALTGCGEKAKIQKINKETGRLYKQAAPYLSMPSRDSCEKSYKSYNEASDSFYRDTKSIENSTQRLSYDIDILKP